MKVKEIIKMLEDDGWQLVRTKGSHRQFKHRTKVGIITVAGKLSVDTKSPSNVTKVGFVVGSFNILFSMPSSFSPCRLVIILNAT
ncbi:type II toxin-antitoxin system HicA family toxin [bacterium]|nr:type II toxin-antitoxin system HicA family toxin [bacterium]MBU1599931.1 type II toxin-antitoxin system HicA family toxin [bacterium]